MESADAISARIPPGVRAREQGFWREVPEVTNEEWVVVDGRERVNLDVNQSVACPLHEGEYFRGGRC